MGPGLGAIIGLNAAFLAAGLALLWGIRGFPTWLDVLDGLGLALFLGVCSVGVLATFVLIGGTGLATATVAGLCAAVAAAGLAIGRIRRRPLPRGLGARMSLTPGTAVSAVAAAAGFAAAAVIVVAFFRLAHVAPLGGGDSFQFWVPKAKLIYFTGNIGSSFFTTLPGPRYPLFVPALLAMDFRFMGTAYAPPLALQYWLLYVGFLLASASLLRRLVPAWLAWLFVALTGTIPQLDGRLLGAQADWTLDMELAVAALLALAWLRLRERWLLVSLTIVLAALIATKQEGLLLAGCLYVGLAIATLRDRRATWIPLIAVLVLAYLANLPWRIWWETHKLPVVLPTIGFLDLFHHLSRFWPSLHLVLRLQFQYEMWLAFIPIALAAAAASLTLAGEARRTALIYLGTAATAIAGFTWILWSDLTYTLNESQAATPIPRVVGSIALLSTVVAPVLIAPLLQLPRAHRPEHDSAA